MTVKSEYLEDGERAARPARTPQPPSTRWDRLPIVLLGTLILGFWWLIGGKYTIDGLPLLLNEILVFFRAPRLFYPVTDWRVYVALCWLPICVSFAERRYAPWRRFALSPIMLWVLMVWLIVASLDAGSTWLAVTNPPRDAYAVSRQLAELRPLALIWTIGTTFLPESAIAALWWWLRKG